MYRLYFQATGFFGRVYDEQVSYWFPHTLAVGQSVHVVGGLTFSAASEAEVSSANTAWTSAMDALPWLTYRAGFEPLTEFNPMTSDKGWGCAVRSAQMLTASSLVEAMGDESRSQILRLFVDSFEAPLSLHRVVEIGLRDRFIAKLGDWFGPASATGILVRLARELDLGGVGMHTFMDQMLVRPTMTQLLLKHPRGVLMFVPVMLGVGMCIDSNEFKPQILSLFRLEQFRGFVGGDCVSHSYFFAAGNEEKLFILDPHVVQPKMTIENVDQQIPQPYMMGMRWPRLNPSMSLGFFVRHMEDFDAVAAAVSPLGVSLINEKPPRARRTI